MWSEEGRVLQSDPTTERGHNLQVSRKVNLLFPLNLGILECNNDNVQQVVSVGAEKVGAWKRTEIWGKGTEVLFHDV